MEIAISLGILSVAIIPLMGLLSVGFSTMRDSQSEMRITIVAQKLLAEAQMTPFTQLKNQTYLLDLDGNRVSSLDAVIEARLNVEKGSAANFLGSANAAQVSVSLKGTAVTGERIFSATVANLGD